MKMPQNAPTFKSGMNAAISKIDSQDILVLNRIFAEAGRRSRLSGKASAIREAPPFRAKSFTISTCLDPICPTYLREEGICVWETEIDILAFSFWSFLLFYGSHSWLKVNKKP
jgi:hypothetical protein